MHTNGRVIFGGVRVFSICALVIGSIMETNAYGAESLNLFCMEAALSIGLYIGRIYGHMET